MADVWDNAGRNQ